MCLYRWSDGTTVRSSLTLVDCTMGHTMVEPMEVRFTCHNSAVQSYLGRLHYGPHHGGTNGNSHDLWLMLGGNIPLLYLVNNGLTFHTTIPVSKVSIPGKCLQLSTMLGHCSVSESRYIALRNQLDELGYHYTLGVESVHLVEQILSDFVHTTNNLYHYKQLAQRCIEEQRNFDLGVAPYKEDNARLVQECNTLHLKLMHTQEDARKLHKGLKRQLRKLEMENRDLRFVNSQQLARIKELELECVDSSKKLMEQQCIEYTGAGINTGPASKKKTIPRPSSVSRGRHRKIVSEPLRAISPSQKESGDMAGGQENQVPHLATLRSELSLLQEKCSQQADSLVLLNEMVRARDCEIARLSSLLEGGRPHKAVCKDYFKCNNKCDELREELIRLGETNKQLEDHLADAVMKQHEAMTRAIQLADQLKMVTRDTRCSERDGGEEHCKDSSNLTRLQERLDQVERELQHNKALHSRLETAQHDKNRLEEAQGSSAEERRKMTDRINQFTLIEQDLMEEIQHLKESSSLQKRRISELEEQVRGRKSSRRGSSTDVKVAEHNGSIVEKLESERDRYCTRLKQQGEKLRALEAKLEEAQLVLKDKDQQLTTLHQQLLELQEANRQLHQEKFDAQTQADILFGDKEALETRLKSLQSNRDTHRGEKITSDKVVSQQPLEEQLESCRAELCQQRALYNQLTVLQEQTDRALADAQSQLSAVQSELSTLQDRVQELERERTLLEREVTGLKAERNTQRSTLAQVDQERDTLLLAVDNKTEQLAALEQDLKAKDTHLTKLKEVVADLQKKLACSMALSASSGYSQQM
uniref:Uncharacterized protein n=1 Tax=Timema douglasi TaxID=61478 RepID=A0A7R8VTK1_TIMDO|nr:unnamed protein product [Timema douglasi]